MRLEAILLPGGVMPAGLAYGSLIEQLGDDVDAVAKDLEVYAGPEPPAGYTLEHEVAGVLRTARELGNDELSPEEREVWREFDRISTLPAAEMMSARLSSRRRACQICNA